MGSTISILNETGQKLHIGLKQATPLYFENDLEPGDSVTWGVGKVWFTMEVRLGEQNNKYNLIQDTVVPISLIAGSSIVMVGGVAFVVASGGVAGAAAVGSTLLAENVIVGTATRAALTGVKGLGVADAFLVLKECAEKICKDNKVVVSSRGLYLGSSLMVAIREDPARGKKKFKAVVLTRRNGVEEEIDLPNSIL